MKELISWIKLFIRSAFACGIISLACLTKEAGVIQHGSYVVLSATATIAFDLSAIIFLIEQWNLNDKENKNNKEKKQ